MLDSIEVYLNNIAAAATQAVENGGPLAELSASLAISVNTVAAQAKETKPLYKHINAPNKKENPTPSRGTTAGGGMTGNMYPHCYVVGRSALQKNNACYFDPKKMTDMREWARKLMDKKVVAYKDNN